MARLYCSHFPFCATRLQKCTTSQLDELALRHAPLLWLHGSLQLVSVVEETDRGTERHTELLERSAAGCNSFLGVEIRFSAGFIRSLLFIRVNLQCEELVYGLCQ